MAHISSKQSFSSDDSDFNDDSDAEDLGLSTDDVSLHINGWTSGAQANLKSSQFVIEDQKASQGFRQQVREANADVMSQIDKVMSDVNFDEQHETIVPSPKKIPTPKANQPTAHSFHEMTGTASTLHAKKEASQSRQDHPPQHSKTNSKSKSKSKMSKMSILGRSSSTRSSFRKKPPRKAFESLPQSIDDDEEDDDVNYDNDSKSPKKRFSMSKPKNVDAIAGKYLFSSKKPKKVSSNQSSEEYYESIISSSNALLESLAPGMDHDVHSTGQENPGQETVVFAYDEELHDFVPTKRTIHSGSYMKQWWKNRPTSSKANKNIRKMVRFSSDHQKYGLTENNGRTNDNGGGKGYNSASEDMMREDSRVTTEDRRAAMTYIVSVAFLSIFFLVGLAKWNPVKRPEVEWGSSDSPPELDYNADGDDKFAFPELENQTDVDDHSDAYNDSKMNSFDPPQEAHTNQTEETSVNEEQSYPTPGGSNLISDDVMRIIQTISDKEKILTADTTQNKAGAWISIHYNSGSTQESSSRVLQRYILANLFYATSGETEWKSKADWLSDKHECEWFGISCSMDGDLNPEGGGSSNGENIVTGIDLSANGLSGTLPSEMGFFKNLKSLWLFDNNIIGEMPLAMLHVDTLVELYLNDNKMSGEIPQDIGMLENLEGLDLSSNNFVGKIPNGIGNMESLSNLRLSNNQLTGEFPVEILDLSYIREIVLDNNLIEGEIPKLIGDLQNLQILRLSHNELYGSIPYEVGDLVNLRELILNDCVFTGSIPTTINNLKNLRKLVLSKNMLSNEIPTEIGALDNLEILQLDYNKLDGLLPRQIGSLENLKELNLESTEIKGPIPDTFIGLKSVENLNLMKNELTGEIPDWMAQLHSMQELNLNGNKFVGTIPDRFSEFKALNELRLNDNNLSGIVPDGMCQLKLSTLIVDCYIVCSCCNECKNRRIVHSV